MAKFFKYAFGQAGILTPIPNDTQIDGSISYEQGFSTDYTLNPQFDPVTAKEVPLAQTNQYLNDITGAVQQYQINGFPDFITTADNDGVPYPYDINSYVRYNDQIYFSLIDNNTDTPPSANWELLSITAGSQENLIIGGLLGTNPWQRQITFSLSAASNEELYTADRFLLKKSNYTGLEISATQDTDVPDPSIFDLFSLYSLKLEVTANPIPTNPTEMSLIYPMEGYDFQAIAQRPFTIALIVKSSEAGIYTLALQNSGKDQSFLTEISINLADTWELKVINIPASPSSGTWDYKNNLGLSFRLQLASSTKSSGTLDVWQAADVNTSTNQTNWAATVGNTFYLCAIKVEPGTNYTGWIEMQEAETLDKCLRYYEKTYEMNYYEGDVITLGENLGTSNSLGNLFAGISRFTIRKRGSSTAKVYNPNGSQGLWNSALGSYIVTSFGTSESHFGWRVSHPNVGNNGEQNGFWTVDADFYGV